MNTAALIEVHPGFLARRIFGDLHGQRAQLADELEHSLGLAGGESSETAIPCSA